MGLSLMGVYGILRTIDICFVSLFDTEPPRWIQDGKLLPLPETLTDRVLYAIDLCVSVRGRSWFKGTVWNWSSPWMKRIRPSHTSRFPFLVSNLKWLVIQYILLDILDTINHRHSWSLSNPSPITSLPVHEQIICSLSLCICTVLSINIPCIIYSAVLVPLGCPIEAWPSMFDHPLQASSLRDFWTNRWHEIFRRTFNRLSDGILDIIPSSILSKDVRRIVRASIIFSFSAIFHLFLIQHTIHSSYLRMNGSTSRDFVDQQQQRGAEHNFFDPPTLKFFLSQPFGLLLERAIIIPTASKLAPRSKDHIIRAWAWGWLVYSSRWWCDAWVHAGMWNEEETMVGWSPVRGILKGQWWLV